MVEFILVVLIVGVIGWKVMQSNSTKDYEINYHPTPSKPRSPTIIDATFEKSKTSIPSHVFFDIETLVGNNMDYILLSLTNSVQRCLGKNLDYLEKVCTMEMGKPYCKIYRYDSDEYKWPKFTELIEHCLNGGSDVYIPNLGKANVDVRLMAKCYWVMKR